MHNPYLIWDSPSLINWPTYPSHIPRLHSFQWLKGQSLWLDLLVLSSHPPCLMQKWVSSRLRSPPTRPRDPLSPLHRLVRPQLPRLPRSSHWHCSHTASGRSAGSSRASSNRSHQPHIQHSQLQKFTSQTTLSQLHQHTTHTLAGKTRSTRRATDQRWKLQLGGRESGKPFAEWGVTVWLLLAQKLSSSQTEERSSWAGG